MGNAVKCYDEVLIRAEALVGAFFVLAGIAKGGKCQTAATNNQISVSTDSILIGSLLCRAYAANGA